MTVTRAGRMLATLLVGCGAVAACGVQRPASDVDMTPASQGPGGGTVMSRTIPESVGSLALRDQRGLALTLDSLRGKVIVLADFLTTCQEVCPLTSVNLRDIADATRRAGLESRVEVLEVTVDPERDSPARLAAYDRLFGARDNWRFLTGRPADLSLLWQFFGVAYGRTPDKPPYPKDWLTGQPLTYDVMHQDVVFVIDRQGKERWLTIGTAATDGTQPPPTLDAFLDTDGRADLRAPGPDSWTAEDVEAAVASVAGEKVG